MAKQQVAVKQARTVPIVRNGQTALTKYTEEVHKSIVDTVQKGNSITDAALLAGLGRDTVWGWLEKGRREPEKYPEWAQLSADIAKAQANRRVKAVENIVTVGDSQAPGSWQANAWFLERTDPENWGRKDKVEHVGDGTPKTQINTVVLIDGEARETARDLLQRVAGHSGADKSIGSGSGMQLENGDS
jgi:hypothetical protein